MGAGVLYISYDGLLDPLGQSQVLPYIRELARRGVRLTAISFEKPELASFAGMDETRAVLKAAGVNWHPLRYHRRPTLPATGWDILRGIWLARRLVRRQRIGIIHARSYIAGLIAIESRGGSHAKFLFDMRGFWPDERVEGGSWKAGGAIYRTVKKLERRLLAEADGIVSLTHRGAEILRRAMLPAVRQDMPPVAVIPTCADLELFRPPERKPEKGAGVRLVYLGSLGSWYMPEEMFAFFAALLAKAPGSSFRLLTNSPAGMVEQAMDKAGIAASARERVSSGPVPHAQVPLALAEADCTVSFIRPCFSKQASCATKFGESLACGVPVVINSGVGDHDVHLAGRNCGVVLPELSPAAYGRAADELLELLQDSNLGARCRALAESGFSLAGAVDSYLALYSTLAGGSG